MAVYDMLMLVVLASATILGIIKGFAWQIASLASIVVSYVVAYRYRNDVAAHIDARHPWNVFLAMLLLYAVVSFAIWIAFRLISNSIDKVRLKEFDRHMGGLLGFAKGVLLCVIITMFAMTLLDSAKQQAICESRSGYYISKLLANANGVLPKEVEQVVGPFLNRLEQQLQARRTGEPTPQADNWLSPNHGLGNLPSTGPASPTGNLTETLRSEASEWFGRVQNNGTAGLSNGIPATPTGIPVVIPGPVMPSTEGLLRGNSQPRQPVFSTPTDGGVLPPGIPR